MYKLTKEDKVISSSKIVKLVIGYIVVTLMCLAIPYFNKYLIDNALNQNWIGYTKLDRFLKVL